MLLGPKEFSIIWTGHRPEYCPWTALVGSLYYLWASSPFLSPRLHLFGYFSVLGHHASLCRGEYFVLTEREREREKHCWADVMEHWIAVCELDKQPFFSWVFSLIMPKLGGTCIVSIDAIFFEWMHLGRNCMGVCTEANAPCLSYMEDNDQTHIYI